MGDKPIGDAYTRPDMVRWRTVLRKGLVFDCVHRVQHGTRPKFESGQYADGFDPETVLVTSSIFARTFRPPGHRWRRCRGRGIARRTEREANAGRSSSAASRRQRKIGARGRGVVATSIPRPTASIRREKCTASGDTTAAARGATFPETPAGMNDQSGGWPVDTPSTPDAGGEAATATDGDLDFP